MPAVHLSWTKRHSHKIATCQHHIVWHRIVVWPRQGEGNQNTDTLHVGTVPHGSRKGKLEAGIRKFCIQKGGAGTLAYNGTVAANFKIGFRDNSMKFFVDSADIEAISDLAAS